MKEAKMFVKFIREIEGTGISNRKGSPYEAVMPHQDFLIEADRIEYAKLRYDNDDLGTCTVFGLEPEDGVEYIELRLPTTGDRIVATHCTMFVMNDEGQTIDSLVCP